MFLGARTGGFKCRIKGLAAASAQVNRPRPKPRGQNWGQAEDRMCKRTRLMHKILRARAILSLFGRARWASIVAARESAGAARMARSRW
jgi:hypothetical protein